jgi:hypothetical protein
VPAPGAEFCRWRADVFALRAAGTRNCLGHRRRRTQRTTATPAEFRSGRIFSTAFRTGHVRLALWSRNQANGTQSILAGNRPSWSGADRRVLPCRQTRELSVYANRLKMTPPWQLSGTRLCTEKYSRAQMTIIKVRDEPVFPG